MRFAKNIVNVTEDYFRKNSAPEGSFSGFQNAEAPEGHHKNIPSRRFFAFICYEF